MLQWFVAEQVEEEASVDEVVQEIRDVAPAVAGVRRVFLADGDALPSVRNVAAEYRLNPLTVLKGYQELVDEGLVEKKRGRGMFVNEGARIELLKAERQRFLEKEWPLVRATIERLGLDPAELLDSVANKEAGDKND